MSLFAMAIASSIAARMVNTDLRIFSFSKLSTSRIATETHGCTLGENCKRSTLFRGRNALVP